MSKLNHNDSPMTLGGELMRKLVKISLLRLESSGKNDTLLSMFLVIHLEIIKGGKF